MVFTSFCNYPKSQHGRLLDVQKASLLPMDIRECPEKPVMYEFQIIIII